MEEFQRRLKSLLWFSKAPPFLVSEAGKSSWRSTFCALSRLCSKKMFELLELKVCFLFGLFWIHIFLNRRKRWCAFGFTKSGMILSIFMSGGTRGFLLCLWKIWESLCLKGIRGLGLGVTRVERNLGKCLWTRFKVWTTERCLSRKLRQCWKWNGKNSKAWIF